MKKDDSKTAIYDLIHIGKNQITYNIDLNEVKKIAQEIVDENSAVLREQFSATTKDLQELTSLFTKECITFILSVKKELATSNENLKQTIDDRSRQLQSDIKTIFDGFIKEFVSIKNDALPLIKNLKEFEKYIEGDFHDACEAIKQYSISIEQIEQRTRTMRTDRRLELELGFADLRNAKFDSADENFKIACEDTAVLSDALYGRALAQCGIQILYDYDKKCEQPILHNIDLDLSQNSAYQQAIKNCSDDQRTSEYEAFCNNVREIKRHFVDYKKNGIDYDCFLCVKVTDRNGEYTKDKEVADKIYDMLIHAKPTLRIFYSEESNIPVGDDDEKYILYALYKSKCMIVVCLDEDYLNTPWIKNEYIRFDSFRRYSGKPETSLTIAFDGKAMPQFPSVGRRIQGIKLGLSENHDISSVASGRIINFVDTAISSINGPDDIVNTGDKVTTKEENPDFNTIPKAQEEENVTKTNAEAERQAREEAERKVREAEEKIKELEKKLEEALKVQKNETYAEVIKEKKPRLRPEEIETKITKNMSDEVKEIYKNAKAGDAVEQNDLADCYYDGEGVEQDYKKAVEWYTKSAEQGYARAQCNLGMCYYNGKGVEKNIEKAIYWYKKAAEQGHVVAREALAKVETNITPSMSASKKNKASFPKSEKSLYDRSIPEMIKKGNILEITADVVDEAYQGRPNLYEVVIFPGVKSIGDRAFLGSKRLIRVFIPKNVKMGENVFQSCAKYTQFYCEEKSQPLDWPLNWKPGDCEVEWGTTYKSYKAQFWESKKEFVTKTETEAEVREKDLKPSDEKSNAEALSAEHPILFNDSTEFEMDGYVLKKYRGKKEKVMIPYGVTDIGCWAFSDCTGLTSIAISNSVTSIDEYAFYKCTGLKTVAIGNGVTNIGRYAFDGCTSLNLFGVAEENNVFQSKDGVLYKKENKSIYLVPKAIEGAVTILDGCTSIDWDAFSGCIGLTSVIIPDSVTSIGEEAFAGCTGLTSITIPNSVTIINRGAFSDCTGLQTVYYEGTSEQWYYDFLKIGVIVGSKEGIKDIEDAKIYYFSSYPIYDRKHWHWDGTHTPKVWKRFNK